MRKIIEYKLVAHGDTENIERRVNKLISEGWQVLGAIVSFESCGVQTMVKYEETPPSLVPNDHARCIEFCELCGDVST